ncbi:N-acetylglucosamine-6-phosphate deacetylase [Paenibacillus arenilitoris]|uniref:N-acetylglucosamine-6-phosphate deacetylase n=1 Tax=Paenibacillus arenilitoris TaxID=2772299 RepID=A0A927CPN1_9BACL|nr:N-acetylglucosamine-6-phosphate deacetylase [Paenibacillus arenilitoris]MBD2870503.1 N-acetylglucosamine-6-phosphate deacetylase [Paenibacillus arenilitoris]
MAEISASWLIRNANVVLEDRTVSGGVLVQDGVIRRILTDEEEVEDGEALGAVDGQGGWLLPGFIDMHVHGGFGADFMDASRESYDAITRFHASYGTTGMLATTMTASKEAIEAVLAAAEAYREGEMPYAALYGVHLEGPFISEKWPGAQNPAHITDPQPEWLKRWAESRPGLIRQVTLAPEKNGAKETIAWLAEHGIVAACGHTDALYADIVSAADAGLTQAVHTYNAMRGLHHREPGTLGAVLTEERIYAELIADGMHVHPAAIRLLLAAKKTDKVILITDAMAAAGMPDGDYELGGLAVVVKGGEARLREGNALAGSCLTMIGAVRFMLEHTELGIVDVSRLASGNAARQLGLFGRTGSIAGGKQADLVLTDAQFNVKQTWVNGRSVYASDSQGEMM